MSLLSIGVSHRTAPMSLLERVALDPAGADRLTTAALAGQHVCEAVVLATCNRVEVYAEVTAFHAGLLDLGHALAAVTDVPLTELAQHLSVDYADRAVAQLFSVACGLESMAVGEGQVLGQLRLALRAAQDRSAVGPVLHQLVQRALRVGKRAHAETGIDRVGSGLIEAGLARARQAIGPLADRRVLIVGAGSMSGLAAATVRRSGAGSITVVNRTAANAARLAAAVGGRAADLADLTAELAEADLVVSCTGAVGQVIELAAVRTAAGHRARAGAGPQQFLDLALPRDVDPRVAEVPGVRVADLAALGGDLAGSATDADLRQVRDLVAEEVTDYLALARVQAVAPAVTALRARAAQVVQGELARLDQRLPDVGAVAREELQLTVHRVVEKLLHAPTVRVKELAGRRDGAAYAAALRELFDLPADVTGVATAAEVPLDQDVAALFAALPAAAAGPGRASAGHVPGAR
jgi:glutamyl-tRNA reductase